MEGNEGDRRCPRVDLPLVFSLKLSGNSIASVSRAAFSSLPLLLQAGAGARLCLGRNPLDCCGLEWMRDLEALDFLCDDKATCEGPGSVRGRALKETEGNILCDK